MSNNEYSILSNKDVGMSKSVFVEYNPNDFFYAIANKEGGIETPNKEKCDNLDIHNIEEPKLDLLPDLLIDEIEVLE